MSAPTREEFDRLHASMATLEARHDATIAELAALRRLVARPRRRRALLPALCLTLLVALVPLGVLAASPFTDLTGGVHDANIGAIYEAGVTKGCVPDAEYCPKANVTREEMASFLARLGGLGSNPPVANAAHLGGQPASAYLRAGQDAAVGNLAVAGTLASPRFRARELIFDFGPLPRTTTFEYQGGVLLLFVSGSGYRAATEGRISMWVDVASGGATRQGIVSGFTNEPVSHKPFTTGVLAFQLPAGTATLTLSAVYQGSVLTLTDANDIYQVTALELPIDAAP